MMKKNALSGSSGGTAACDLPDDIIFNILLHLPAKSLIRFKTLAKSWNALITSPSFIRQHHSQQPSSKILMTETSVGSSCKRMDPLLLTFNDTTLRCHPDMYKPFIIKPYCRDEIIWVMGPCFGVFCFGMFSNRTETFTITLCNITTGETKMVPHLNTLERVFPLNAFGFGCVVDNNGVPEFKVVRLPSFWDQSALCHVYSSATNIWKSIELPCQSCFAYLKGTEVNGVIYWLANTRPNSQFIKILTFDLEKEVFGDIAIPNCGTKKSALFLVNTKQDNHQYLLLIAGPGSSVDLMCADIWVMCAGESWVRQTICDGESLLLGQQRNQQSSLDKVSWLAYWHSVGGMFWMVHGTSMRGILLVIGDKHHECCRKFSNIMLFDYVESIVSFNLEKQNFSNLKLY